MFGDVIDVDDPVVQVALDGGAGQPDLDGAPGKWVELKGAFGVPLHAYQAGLLAVSPVVMTRVDAGDVVAQAGGGEGLFESSGLSSRKGFSQSSSSGDPVPTWLGAVPAPQSSGMVRAAFAARVSTDDQQDPTLSLPRQLSSATSKCKVVQSYMTIAPSRPAREESSASTLEIFPR